MAENNLDKYYENYTELFATEGWKQFIKECKESLDANINILNCKTDQEFQNKRGLAEAYNRICNFESYVRAAMELEEEDANHP